MKKYLSYLGASLVAIAALSSCNKELTDPNEGIKGGIPFEITAASVDTKTSIDGVTTSWVAGDAINLFHAVAGTTTYKSDGQFTITAENLDSKKFTGTLASPLVAGNYDWYAIYPYKEQISSPGEQTDGFVYIGHSVAANQNGNNSKAHLCKTLCPLYGVSKSVEATKPVSLEMKHLTSVVEINVTNRNDDPLTVSSISFSTDEDIVGTYYINFAGEDVVYNPSGVNYVKTVANLTVQNGTALAKGETASFYIPIKPHVAENGSSINISVNGYKKSINLTKDVTFTAGKIKKINFNYDKVVADYVTIPWIEDFSGDLSIYSLVNGETETKTFAANLAGGTAPELLVSNTNGSFSAKVKASAGNYVLTFKSNHADYLSISVDATAITLTKVSDTEYSLSIPDGVDFFNVTFTNTNESNTRLDNIELVSSNRTALGTPEVKASLNKTDASVTNSIDVTWNAVKNAGSYVVTATPATGSAVSETVTAVESTTTYKHTFSGLAYNTEYTISVVAKPSDTSLYLDSAAGEAAPVTTGAKPAEAGVSWSRVTTVAELLAGGTFIIGYEATANSGEIIPMAKTGSASTTAAGFIYSGSTATSGGTGTIDMSTVSETSKYEVTIVASTSVSGAICIKLGDNFLGNTNTKNNCKLFTTESATTAFTPTVGDNDVFTLKIAANKSYHTLQYNASSPRFAVYGGAQKNVVIYKKGN